MLHLFRVIFSVIKQILNLVAAACILHADADFEKPDKKVDACFQHLIIQPWHDMTMEERLV